MEVEVKGKAPKDLDPEGKGWEFVKEVFEEDVYFQHPCKDFGETDEALRVRSSEGKMEITYKGPKVDSITKSREEISCKTSEEILKILEKLGFKPVGKVMKRRKIYRKGNLSLFIDEVWGEAFGTKVHLGKYVEVEGIGEYKDLLGKVLKEAENLGIKNFERRSYLELVLERAKLSRS